MYLKIVSISNSHTGKNLPGTANIFFKITIIFRVVEKYLDILVIFLVGTGKSLFACIIQYFVPKNSVKKNAKKKIKNK